MKSLPPGIALPGWCRHRNGPRGFTLIELAIALAVVAILSAVCFSFYRGMVHRARMTQAKTVLSHLHRTETLYFANNDRYTDNVDLLDFDPVKYPFYRISVVLDNGALGFTGYATGVGAMAGDLWFVTGDGMPTQDNTSTFRF